MRAIETLFLKRLFKRLKDETSGNALLLVALGLPALIAGAGLGVDVTQWYMWKRELQYAVDQAAVAGAWARVRTDTSATFETRATQEFNANLSVLKGMTTTPEVHLAIYGQGVQVGPGVFQTNSVTVRATASRALPFSGFFVKAPVIDASAQAVFESGTQFSACLESVDQDADVGITIGGNTVLTAGCGMASLSTSDTSIQVDGNPEVRLGTIEAAGGIDTAWFAAHDPLDTVKPYATGLFDPFKDLEPPNPAESQVARTYACAHGKTTSTATQTTGVTTTYAYYKGADPINDFAHMVTANYNNRNPNTSTSSSKTIIVDGVPTNGSTTTTYWTPLNGSKANTLWEQKVVVTDSSYTGIVTTTPPDTALLNPGTYSGGIHVQCDTQLNTGVYVLDGGGLTITGQYRVTGSAVMFVLKNGAYIDIAGGSTVTLTAMQAADLIARGVSTDDASKLAGMLVFEARDSTSNKDRLNGNSETTLNGKIYLPNSNIDFSGTAKVTSQCLMIATATIRFVGTSNMTTFCPGGATNTGVVVGSAPTRVKLVA